MVVEAGTHSPWTSRIIAARCAEACVANPRRLGLIFRNARKSDRLDAELLARVGRMDPQLLSPIRHRGEQAQHDLALIRARAALVSARTKLVNALRGLVKSTGARLRKQATKSIGWRTRAQLPDAGDTEAGFFPASSGSSELRRASEVAGMKPASVPPRKSLG